MTEIPIADPKSQHNFMKSWPSAIRSRLVVGEFVRNVLVVMTGTTLAQAISILISPILTRLYLPSEYGVYALFLSLSTMVATIVSGKYEMAIMLPDQDKDAFNVLCLSFLVAVGVTACLFPIVYFFNTQIALLLNEPQIAPWLYAVPVMAFIAGIYNALTYWYNRKKNFKRLSVNRITRVSVSATINISMGLVKFGAIGLIGGWFAGQGLATGQLVWISWKEDRLLRPFISLSAMRRMAQRYKNFPKFQIPTTIVQTASSQFPSILFATFFGSTTLGLFALANTTINLPMSLLADSIRDVFWQSASQDYIASGSCRVLFVKTLKRLFVLSILPCLGLFVLGPFLFAIIFGQKWAMSGEFVRILAPMLFFRFISSPLSSVIYIAEKQKWNLCIQISQFVLVVGSLMYVARVTADPTIAVMVFSGIYSLKYLLELYLSYHFSQSSDAARLAI